MKRFSIPKVLSQRKSSEPSASSQPGIMEDLDITNVHSTEDDLSDSMLITTDQGLERENEEGIVISSERPSYTNVSETKMGDGALNILDDSENRADSEIDKARRYLVKPEELPAGAVGGTVIVPAADTLISPVDPQDESAMSMGQVICDVPEEPPTKDRDNVSESNSDLSIPSEVGSSVLEEPEQKLLEDLNKDSNHEELREGLIPDDISDLASHDIGKQVVESQLSTLTASHQSESHTVDTFMNVGNCLMESQEKMTKEAVRSDDDVSLMETDSNQPGETVAQKLWSQIVGQTAWAKSRIASPTESSAKIATHQSEILPETPTNDNEEVPSKEMGTRVETSTHESAAQENSQNEAQPETPTSDNEEDPSKEMETRVETSTQKTAAQENSQNEAQPRQLQPKKTVWKLTFGFLVLILISSPFVFWTAMQRTEGGTSYSERLEAVPDSTVTPENKGQDTVPDVIAISLTGSVESPEQVTWEEDKLDDKIPDIKDVSAPELSENDTLIAEDVIGNTDMAGLTISFSATDLETIQESEPKLRLDNANTDSPHGDEASPENTSNIFRAMLSRLMKFLRLVVAVLTTGAVGVTWLKTKIVPTKASPSNEVKEEVPPVPSPHGNRRRNYHPLPKDIDLSKYWQLRVDELRALLSGRNLDQTGRKPKLIRRLVDAYEKELWDGETVLSLRAILKEKNLKQGGLKHELVARIIEAGV